MGAISFAYGNQSTYTKIHIHRFRMEIMMPLVLKPIRCNPFCLMIHHRLPKLFSECLLSLRPYSCSSLLHLESCLSKQSLISGNASSQFS